MTLAELMRLWDLGDDYHTVSDAAKNTRMHSVAPDADSTRHKAVPQKCASCGHSIRERLVQHWCEGCGSCLPTAVEHSTDQRHLNTTGHRTVPNSFSTKPVSSASRRWNKESSSFLMWRKPSSLDKTQAHKADSHASVIKREPAHSSGEHWAPIDMLPYEIWIRIMKSLALSDLYSCMLVCKRLNHISTDPILWKNIQLHGKLSKKWLMSVASRAPLSLSFANCTGHLSVHTLTKSFILLGQTLQSLTVDTCNFGPESVDLLVTTCAHCCPVLSSLAVSWSTLSDITINYLAARCHNIRSLTFSHVSGVTPKAIRGLVASQKLSLQTLVLHLHPQPSLSDLLPVEQLPQVSHFTFYSGPASPITQEVANAIYKTLPNLISVTVECAKMTDAEYLFTNKQCTVTIKSLDT